MEEKTHFTVDPAKCIGCGKCVNVCSGMVLELKDDTPVLKPFERFGWRGCWRCQHCLRIESGTLFFDRAERTADRNGGQSALNAFRLIEVCRERNAVVVGKNHLPMVNLFALRKCLIPFLG